MTEKALILPDLQTSEHSFYQDNKYNSLFVLSKQCEPEQMMLVSQRNDLLSKTQNDNDINIDNTMKLQRKRGRIKKGDNDNISSSKYGAYPSTIHSKYFQDNIKRKIKTHFHNFIIAYLNIESKKACQSLQHFRFKKMESTITQDIRISENKKLLQRPLKDILGNVSKKFKDKEQNNKYMNHIYSDGGHMKELLETNYETMFNNYYLKSTHKMFENTGEKDESFEEHLDLIEKKDGFFYMKQYKKNAETFVEFFKNCKERKRKKLKHNNNDSLIKETKLQMKQELNQNSINTLNDVNHNSEIIINNNNQNEINANEQIEIQNNNNKQYIKNNNNNNNHICNKEYLTMPVFRMPPRLCLNFSSFLPFQQRNVINNNSNNYQLSYSHYNLNHLYSLLCQNGNAQNHQYGGCFYYYNGKQIY